MTKRNLMLALALLTLVLGVVGCSVARPTTTITQVAYEYRDSVRWRDSVILVPIPVERYVDVVAAYDTLRLETGVASAAAYVDTLTHTLRGTLVNKPDCIRTTIKYRDRLVTVTKDSLVTKEIPVEVEVIKTKTPRWAWVLLVFDLLVLLVIGAFAYLKFS